MRKRRLNLDLYLKNLFAFVLGLVVFAMALISSGCAIKDSNIDAGQVRVVFDWPKMPETLEFVNVTGVACDDGDNIYMAACPNSIVCFGADGQYKEKIGNGIIKDKHGCRIFGNKLWVTDIGTHQVYEFDLQGNLLNSFGVRNESGLGANIFNKPTDVAIASNGDIYITDGYGNSRVVCFDCSGNYKFEWGSAGQRPGQFKYPHNIVIDSKDRIYIADRGNNRIQVFDRGGKFLRQFTNIGKPYGLAIDKDEMLYVTDGQRHRVLMMDTNGDVICEFGRQGSASGQFKVPHSVAVDEIGNIYIAEVGNKRVQKFVKTIK